MTLLELRLMLLLWAKHARGHGAQLGYPRSAAFVQGRGHYTEPDWPPTLWSVERGLCRLRDAEPGDYRVLTTHYLYTHWTLGMLAEESRLPLPQYQKKIEAIEQNLLTLLEVPVT